MVARSVRPREISEKQVVDREGRGDPLASPGVRAGRHSQDLQCRLEMTPLGAPPSLCGRPALRAPRPGLVPLAVDGSLEEGAFEDVESSGGVRLRDRIAPVRREGQEGLALVRRVSRRIEREGVPVRVAADDGKVEARTGLSRSTPMTANIARPIPCRTERAHGGKRSPEHPVRAWRVGARDEECPCAAGDLLRQCRCASSLSQRDGAFCAEPAAWQLQAPAFSRGNVGNGSGLS